MHLPVTLSFLFVLVSSTLYSQDITQPDTNKYVFEKVDVEASFKGGEQGWRRFLEKNLDPNVPVDNGAPYGRYTVVVQFIVNVDGSVSGIKALTKEGYGTEQEVVRLLGKSGLWTPAQKDGKLVKAYRIQPVTFMVTEYGFDLISNVPYTFFTGKDNELTIEVAKVNSENLGADISEGTLTKTGDGKFIARVTKPGRVLINVYNIKRNNKKIGTASFEVKELKQVPAGVRQ